MKGSKGAKTRSKSEQARCQRYQAQNLYVRNKTKTIKRHLKAHPTDEQSQKALGNLHWRRKTPKKPEWSHSDIAAVKLYILAGRSGKDFLRDKEMKKKRPLVKPKDD